MSDGITDAYCDQDEVRRIRALEEHNELERCRRAGIKVLRKRALQVMLDYADLVRTKPSQAATNISQIAGDIEAEYKELMK